MCLPSLAKTKGTQRKSAKNLLKDFKIIQWYSLENLLKELEKSTTAPKVTGKSTSRKPLSTRLRDALRNQRLMQNTILNQEKEISRYNSKEERLLCELDITCSFTMDLPHNATMGRSVILQQNPLKLQNSVSLEVFDSFGGFLGLKIFKPILDKALSLNQWLSLFRDKKSECLAYFSIYPTDFQNNSKFSLLSKPQERYCYELTLNNFLLFSVYFSVRRVFEHTWINHNDQFYAPYDDAFQSDSEFKHNSLTFMLFHGKNRITTTQGTNHFIPFSEQEVNAKERYTSHVLLDFLKGKLQEQTQNNNLFETLNKEIKPLEFSETALNVFNAGKEIYKYYHSQDFTNHAYNANVSLYDIKEFFQGRNAQGKLNPPLKAKDEYYKQLYFNLQDALKDLAKELQPKVYEYGFLRE